MTPHANKRTAEKMERGANINLNHEQYKTRVVKCCWFCKERFSRRGLKAPIVSAFEGEGVAEFCGDTCVAEFAAEEVMADNG